MIQLKGKKNRVYFTANFISKLFQQVFSFKNMNPSWLIVKRFSFLLST